MATNKLCPFQIITPGPPVTGIYCVQEQCQLWVPNTPDEADIFSTVVGNNNRDGVLVEGTRSQEDGGRCGAQTSDLAEGILRLTHHLHRHHKHPKAHVLCTEIPTGCGDTFFGDTVPKSIKLAMEFESNEDQDGNTKIFGRDFGIIDDDDTPIVLKNLIDPQRRPPQALATWENIKNDNFPPFIRSVKPSVVSKAGGIWVRLTGAFFSGETSAFEIKIGDPDNGIPYVKITTYVRIDFNTLYFLMPSDFSGFSQARSLNIHMKNFGNTFDFPIQSLIFESGGEAVYKNRIKVKMEDDDEELKEQMEDLLAGDQAPVLTTITPVTVNRNGGIWIQIIGDRFPGAAAMLVKVGDPENAIPYIDIEPVVIDDTKLYFMLPNDAFSTLPATPMKISLVNTQTNKVIVYDNRFSIKAGADDIGLVAEMLEMYEEDAGIS